MCRTYEVPLNNRVNISESGCPCPMSGYKALIVLVYGFRLLVVPHGRVASSTDTFDGCNDKARSFEMNLLPKVAEHLCKAARSSNDDEADAFGRSAFNRYYYAAYLSTRDLLAMIDGAWSRTPHRNIPGILEDDLRKRFQRNLKRLKDKGLISDGKAKSLVSQVGAAGSEIASILRTAYMVRVTADYIPEEKVIFEPTTFQLATHTEAEAKNWLQRVDRNKGIVLNAAKEIGLV